MADRRYETLILIHPDQGEAGCQEVTERLKKLVTDQGGMIEQVQDWGMRDLAFLVEKQRRAFYALFEYRATPVALDEIERNLRLMDAVLRFVSVRRADDAPLAAPRNPRPSDEDERPSGDGATGGAPTSAEGGA